MLFSMSSVTSMPLDTALITCFSYYKIHQQHFIQSSLAHSIYLFLLFGFFLLFITSFFFMCGCGLKWDWNSGLSGSACLVLARNAFAWTLRNVLGEGDRLDGFLAKSLDCQDGLVRVHHGFGHLELCSRLSGSICELCGEDRRCN